MRRRSRFRLGVEWRRRWRLRLLVMLGGFVRGQFVVLERRLKLVSSVFVERLPLLHRGMREPCLMIEGCLCQRQVVSGGFWPAPDRSQRLAFGTFDLCGIRAAAALEVEVLADCVVE
jgi:hypothetical protein